MNFVHRKYEIKVTFWLIPLPHVTLCQVFSLTPPLLSESHTFCMALASLVLLEKKKPLFSDFKTRVDTGGYPVNISPEAIVQISKI